MRIGLAVGCFDCFHDGHKFFLKEARLLCDHLIVAVNTDASVRRLKGPERPVEPLKTRMQNVTMRGPDAVIPHAGYTFDLIHAIHPDVLIKGYDQNFSGEMFVQKYGGCVERIKGLPGFSTTSELGKHLVTFSREGSKRKFVVLEDHRQDTPEATSHAPE